MNKRDLGWLEGFIDGEGTLGLRKMKNFTCVRGFGWSPRLEISNTNPALVEKAQQIIGAGSISVVVRKPIRHKQEYQYVLAGAKLLIPLLRLLKFVGKDTHRLLLLEASLLIAQHRSKRNRMKITILTPEDPNDATPNLRALREYNALRDAGHDVEFAWVGLIRTAPPLGKFLERVAYQRAYTKALASAAMIGNPDLLVAHDIYTLSGAVRAAKKLGIPLVYDAHEDFPTLIADNSWLESKIANFIEMRSSRYLSHVFVPTQNLALRFQRMGVPSTVLYNSPSRLQAYALDRDETRAAFGYTKGDFVVGLIGNLAQRTDLTDALLALLHRLPDRYRFLVVGGPKEIADEIRFRAHQQGFADRIHVTGQLPYETLRPWYSVLDLGLVLMDERPAFVASLPNKIFAYMAHTVPVLAPSDYPEIAEVVRESDSGYLVPSVLFRAESLWSIVKAIESLKEGDRRGWNGRLAYLQRFAWEKQAPEFVSVLEDLVQ